MRLRPAALTLLMALTAAGCSTVEERRTAAADDASMRCLQLYRSLDAAVKSAGVRDGGEARVAGFPYLRTNRFLASYRAEPMSSSAQAWWIGRMQVLDTRARIIEMKNLPQQFRASLDARLLNVEDPAADLALCAQELARRDLSNPDAITRLRDAVKVSDEYQTWKRVVGLYPLTALVFLQGVTAYHADTRAVFSTPLDALPVAGRLVRYEPPAASVETAAAVRAILARASENPLKIPMPSASELSRLAAAYAPLLEVDQADRNDEIGMPTLGDGNEPRIDVSRPTMFVRVAHTRFEGEPLLQLVYSVWFPARPRVSTIDLLGGRLDGITWRVTIDRDGEPLLYDSMHNCGCYHMFFPAAGLRLRPDKATLEEPALVGKQLASRPAGARVVLRIAAATHYLQNVRYTRGPEGSGRRQYTFAPDDRLRTLAGAGNARRSLFRPDGIVPGTQRGERYLFWPMGIREPGAMRQWGRHATAFVGRRHFDDPYLVERYFERW